jgi:hypothetical protein
MLPRFVVALPQDALLQSSPPFDYPGVSMRIFPLRADMTRAQTLVDGWLNALLPPEVAYFRVCTPYVFLVALNYGKASVIPANLGWSSQREVTWSIPMQWYKRTSRGLEFHDWAFLTPFIFVDNDLSIPAGREVFGWQKTAINVRAIEGQWLSNPRAPLRHAGMNTMAFREVYAGKAQQSSPFLDIDEGPPGAWLQYQPDRQNPRLPWVALSNAADSISGLTFDLVNLLAGLGITRRREVPHEGDRRVYLDPSPESAVLALKKTLELIDPYNPNMYANEINLKQFRDAEHPTTACYQDVNCTVMRIKEITGLGLLGEDRILAGDVSGGYRITLHQWESLPIADALGLDCKRTTEVDGATVVALKPVLPMWAKMNLGYAADCSVLAWRGKDRGWSIGSGPFAPSLKHPDNDGHPVQIPYNTTLGSSSPVVYGPFETPRATIRVLPLLADPKKLQALCDRSLNGPLHDMEGAGYEFTAWGHYVYVLITTGDATYSTANNLGSWETKTVQFVVPVRCFRDGKLVGYRLYSPFNFSDSSLDTISESEINGARVMRAEIDSPSSTWLQTKGPALERSRALAVVRAMIPPILDAGERALMRTLLHVSQRSTERAFATDRTFSPDWALAVKKDLDRRPPVGTGKHGKAKEKDGASFDDLRLARARAVELLAHAAPARFVALKQFRDLSRPDRACYQSLVEVEQRLRRIERIEEIQYPLDLAIYDYGSMPIAQTLGLVPRSWGYENGLYVRHFEPIRPFWCLALTREELGKNLAEQSRDLVWVRRDQVETRIEGEEAAAKDDMLLHMLDRVDLGDPTGISRRVKLETAPPGVTADSQSVSHGQKGGKRHASVDRVEPQWVIEAMLSREWESTGLPYWEGKKKDIESFFDIMVDNFGAFPVRAKQSIERLWSEFQMARGGSYHPDIVELIGDSLLPRYVALAPILADIRHLNELSGPMPPGAAAPAAAAAPPRPVELPAASPTPALLDGEKTQALAMHYAIDPYEETRSLLEKADALLVNDQRFFELAKEGILGSGAPLWEVLPYAQAVAEKHPGSLVAKFVAENGARIAAQAADSRAELPFDVTRLPEGLYRALQSNSVTALFRTFLYLAWLFRRGTDKGPAFSDHWIKEWDTEVEKARSALVLALAKCWQKPLFCVHRETAGTPEIADSVFQKEQSWPFGNDAVWYSAYPCGPQDQHEGGEK